MLPSSITQTEGLQETGRDKECGIAATSGLSVTKQHACEESTRPSKSIDVVTCLWFSPTVFAGKPLLPKNQTTHGLVACQIGIFPKRI